jgi:mycoredoxin
VSSSEEEDSLTNQSGTAGDVGEQRWPKITIYTTSWCGDCRASKRFMARHGIPFHEFDIEETPEMAEVVVKLNNGRRSVPTIVIEDGPTLVEPSDRELGKALGIV